MTVFFSTNIIEWVVTYLISYTSLQILSDRLLQKDTLMTAKNDLRLYLLYHVTSSTLCTLKVKVKRKVDKGHFHSYLHPK